MLARLGNVMLWTSILLAGVIILLVYQHKTIAAADEKIWAWTAAAIVLLIGLAIRYVLAGGRRST